MVFGIFCDMNSIGKLHKGNSGNQWQAYLQQKKKRSTELAGEPKLNIKIVFKSSHSTALQTDQHHQL